MTFVNEEPPEYIATHSGSEVHAFFPQLSDDCYDPRIRVSMFCHMIRIC